MTTDFQYHYGRFRTEAFIFREAARKGSLEDIERLAAYFSDDLVVLNTALHNACNNGRLNVVKWLVENTAVSNDVDTLGEIVRTSCINYTGCQLHVVLWMLENSAIRYNVRLLARILLYCAHNNVQWEIVKWILEHTDVDVNYDENGNTALHYVTWNNQCDKTTLHEACINGDREELERLVFDREDNVNIQDNNGYTPLHWACNGGHTEIVRFLVIAGADDSVTDDNGDTAEQLAVKTGRKVLLKYLDKNNWNKNPSLQTILVAAVIVMLTALLSRRYRCKRDFFSL